MSTPESNNGLPRPETHEEVDREESDHSSNAPIDEEKQVAQDGGAVKKIKSKASANDVNSVPNGGLVAWLQVLGAFSLFFNTWGVLNTFGVYQTYYEQQHLASSSNISWIGSIQSFLLLFVGAATGPIYDAGHFRILLVTGTFLVVFGHMMLSLINAYWQAVLAQAIVIGLGAGCLFVPSVAIMSTYFTTKVSTAIGIAASGSSLGGVIYPIMFHKLVPEVGFPWAVRIIGFMALALLAIPCVVMKMRVKPAAKRKLFDLNAFKEIPFLLFTLGGFTGFVGLYVIFFYMPYYGLASGYTNDSLSFYLVPILNAASIFGRIIPNIIADKLGPLNLMLPSALISSILTYCVIANRSESGVIAITALYGFFSGTFVSLPASVIVRLTPPDKRFMIGTRLGMFFTLTSFGVLIGAPVAGAILGSDNNFTGMFVFGGTMLMGGAILFLFSRMFKAEWKMLAKV